MEKTIERFLKYFAIGFLTFLFDLSFLYVLTDFIKINYLTSAGLAYLISVSINYYLCRKIVFKGTTRDTYQGYYIFIVISIVGLFIIMGLMFIFVEKLEINYLIARVLIAGIVGIWRYLMNLFVNFKVAGKHLK